MIKKQFFMIYVILFCLYYLSVEALFAAFILVLFCEARLNHQGFRCRLFPGTGIYLYFLFAGLFIGIFHVFSLEYITRNVIKHMVYVLLPVLLWMVGKNISFDNETEWKACITNLFAAGVLVSLCDLLSSLFKIFNEMISGVTLYKFRSMIGAGHPLILVTLFLYIFMQESIAFKKKQIYCCIGILTVDILIHFSRLNFLNLLIFLMYSGMIKKAENFLRLCVLLLAGTATLYTAFPSIFDNYVDRFSNTLTEVSFSREDWDHTAIVTNWRGYEAYCEIRKFQSAGTFEKIMGGGFGAQLDVNGMAYLVTTEAALPFLHNGYFSTLMIWGILGCIFFAAMLLFLYRGNPRLKGRERNFWKALVMSMVLDTFFVHGPFFSPSAALPFLYLAILDSKGQRISGRLPLLCGRNRK